MKTHKWIYSLVFALQAAFVALPGLSEAADIVSVIVVDTQDDSIGDSTAADLYKMQSLVSKIAKNTDLKPRQVILKDQNAVPAKMLNSLKSLKVNQDDVVIFYFSGHGYRTPSKGDSLWPNLYFSLRDEGVEYEKVVSLLQKKNPRLLITMADVCNNVISESQAPLLVRSFFKRVNEDKVTQNYRRLFLETNGLIRVTGAKKGEFAWATPVGGTFTLAFIKSLETEVNSSAPADWTVLLDRVSIDLHRDDQHPVYVVETSSR
jgi:hypothetical protein